MRNKKKRKEERERKKKIERERERERERNNRNALWQHYLRLVKARVVGSVLVDSPTYNIFFVYVCE